MTGAYSSKYSAWYERHNKDKRAASLGANHPLAPYAGQAKPETIELRRVTQKYESRKNQCLRHFLAKPCPECEG
jgi:hypothetical protein